MHCSLVLSPISTRHPRNISAERRTIHLATQSAMEEVQNPANDVGEVPYSDKENGPLLRRHQVAMESKRVRLLPVFELLLPTVAICILLWIEDWQYTGTFYSYVKSNQASMQIVVQIVSHLLAMLQVSSTCALLNLSTRFRSLHRSTPLQDLSLWIALSTARIDRNLPTFHLAMDLTFVAATLIPGTLWAGALSPMFVLKSQELGDQLLPAFTDRTKANWDSQFQLRDLGPQVWNINDDCTVINDARGLVPSCPVPTLQGLLLLSGGSATTLNRNHSKLDVPSWKYIGRSFGVGSSVGHSNDNIIDDRVLYYSYTEFGYITNISCIKNSTSDFNFQLIEYVNDIITASDYQKTYHPELPFNDYLPPRQAVLAKYYVEGYLPNSIIGAPELYPVISWNPEYENITAWAALVNDNRNIIAVAAGTNVYQELNQTQCEVFFTPTAFTVTVDRLQQSISVQAQPSIEAKDIEPTGHLQANVVHSINLLSKMSPSLYVSVLGETLSRNVERMQKQKPHLNQTEAVTSAVAESFTAMMDDILVAYGASQISHAQDVTFSATRGITEAMQIGQPLYRYLVFALNCLMILLVGFEAIRTRGWHLLTKFNYLDLKSVVIASSAGGDGIAMAVWNEHRSHGTEWVGDPCDSIACAMRVEWDMHNTLADTETVAIVKARDCGVVQARERKGKGWGKPIKLVGLDSNSEVLRHPKSK